MDVLDLTLERFKLACISNDVISDEEVRVLIGSVILNSEEDVHEFVAILHKYRPNLEKKFSFADLSPRSVPGLYEAYNRTEQQKYEWFQEIADRNHRRDKCTD